MKIYKVTYQEEVNSSHGYSFHSNKKDADAKLKEFKDDHDESFNDVISKVELIYEGTITPEKVLQLLNRHASHNDNG